MKPYKPKAKLGLQARAFLAKAGRKGAKLRMKSTTPEQRSEIAKLAAKTRWDRVRAERGQA